MGRLDGKIALITGACSGIGMDALELFVAEGAKVQAADIQDDIGQQLVERFKGKVAFAHCDVTSNADIEAATNAAVKNFGGLDILFANAGAAGAPGGIETLDLDAYDRTQSLLVRSVVAGTHYAIPHMKQRGGGSIVITSSVCGLMAGFGPVSYSLAKGAVLYFTKLAAAELAPLKIRVNAVCPGFISTNIFGNALGLDRQGSAQMAEMLADRGASVHPIGRVGRVRDITEGVLYFASDAAGFTTGAHLAIDGALTTSRWTPNAPNPIVEAMGINLEELTLQQT